MTGQAQDLECFLLPERPGDSTICRVDFPPPEFPTGGATVYLNPLVEHSPAPEDD